ncbi:MAG: hypothetical protein L0228_01120 [Planctomycetes bacterium]|nr:hypothetical protein [Planctomycetota bacterium]
MTAWHLIEGRYLERHWSETLVPVGVVDGKRRAEVITQKLRWAFQHSDFFLRPIDDIERLAAADDIAKVRRGRNPGRFAAITLVAEWDGKLPKDESSSATEPTTATRPSDAQVIKDVALDDATMAAAKGMRDHLQSLASANTAIQSWTIWPPSEQISRLAETVPVKPDLPEVVLQPNSTESTDNKKNISQPQPDNVDVRDLCYKLSKNRSAIASKKKYPIDVAREHTGESKGNDSKAQSLMRQARRYRHLWE